ncbi:cytochrome c-type biogenesis protein [Pseudonocardia saturnea]
MPDRRRTASVVLVIAVLVLLAVTVVALSTATRPAPDRVQELAERLRCPVCKSVSIAESQSDTAVAMRGVVAEQVAGGRSDPEIVEYFQARYGDWVLFDPPAAGVTLALWLIPVAAAALGVAALLTRSRGRSRGPEPALSAPDRDRVDAAVARARAASTGEDDQP